MEMASVVNSVKLGLFMSRLILLKNVFCCLGCFMKKYASNAGNKQITGVNRDNKKAVS